MLHGAAGSRGEPGRLASGGARRMIRPLRPLFDAARAHICPEWAGRSPQTPPPAAVRRDGSVDRQDRLAGAGAGRRRKAARRCRGRQALRTAPRRRNDHDGQGRHRPPGRFGIGDTACGRCRQGHHARSRECSRMGLFRRGRRFPHRVAGRACPGTPAERPVPIGSIRGTGPDRPAPSPHRRYSPPCDECRTDRTEVIAPNRSYRTGRKSHVDGPVAPGAGCHGAPGRGSAYRSVPRAIPVPTPSPGGRPGPTHADRATQTVSVSAICTGNFPSKHPAGPKCPETRRSAKAPCRGASPGSFGIMSRCPWCSHRHGGARADSRDTHIVRFGGPVPPGAARNGVRVPTVEFKAGRGQVTACRSPCLPGRNHAFRNDSTAALYSAAFSRYAA